MVMVAMILSFQEVVMIPFMDRKVTTKFMQELAMTTYLAEQMMIF